MNYEDVCKEIDSGGLSVLSDRARDYIKALISRAMESGFKRGVAETEKRLRKGKGKERA